MASKIEIRPKPSKYKVRVKKSSAGLGLFAECDIPKGGKIIEYGGYKITNEEADKKGGKYLFEMIDKKHTIDGTPRWNLARYINHACKPNAEGIWHGNHIWICAKKNIQAGEEINYHYGKIYFEDLLGGSKNCKCQTCVTSSKTSKK